MNNKGQTGIGNLIIFIAMIIVAAITANVFMQTATELQNQALETGKQARETVSTYAKVTGISATDGNDGDVEDFRVELRLAPGSGGMDLSKAMLSGDTRDGGITWTYSNKSCVNDSVNGYHTNTSAENGTFTVKYLVRGDNSQDGYLQRGDMIELCFSTGNSIGEDENLALRFTPSVGIPTVAEFVTPEVIVNQRERLYP